MGRPFMFLAAGPARWFADPALRGITSIWPVAVEESGIRTSTLLACAALLAAAVLAIPARGTPRAGKIDCTHARDAVERFICTHADLRALDASMATSYSAALRRNPQHAEALRHDQRDWLAWRDDLAWQLLSAPALPDQRMKMLYARRIAFLHNVFSLSPIHSAFLKHMCHEAMTGGVSCDDLLEAAGATHADERPFDGLSALLAHLPAPTDAGLRNALQSAFAGSESHLMRLAWLPAAQFGGAYYVGGSAACAVWVFFERRGTHLYLVPHPTVNNGCWNHVLKLVQWHHRAIVVNVRRGLIDPHVDLQLQTWDDGHWSTEERLRLRFARKVSLIDVNCETQTYCDLVKQVGMRVATRYDRRPLPETLAPAITALSKADRARFDKLRNVVKCAGGDVELPRFSRHGHWVGLTGLGREATAFPVRAGGKLILGCISHAHLGWRVGGVWLVGLWSVMGKLPVPLAGLVAGGQGTFLVAAPMTPRVVNH